MNAREFAVWLAQAPPGTLVPARELASLLGKGAENETGVGAITQGHDAVSNTWREKLWTVPADTRLGVREVAEATGRSLDWVYKHTGAAGSGLRLPHRKLDGHLVFLAGELRAWLLEAERIVEPGRQRGPRVACS